MNLSRESTSPGELVPSLSHGEVRSASEPLREEVVSLTTPTFRIILDGAHSGAVNMQRDEALFTAAENLSSAEPSSSLPGEQPPAVTVRLYGWTTPTITLGRHQPQIDELFDSAAVAAPHHSTAQALPPIVPSVVPPIVRRITGGRAVLHDDELTYCVVAPREHPLLGGSIRESYSAIAEILKTFLRDLQPDAAIHSHFAAAERPRQEKSAVCYDRLNWAEITVNERKLIGAAQRRGRRVFLEHGSIPLAPSALSLNTWLNPLFQSQKPLSTITLSDFLPQIDFDTASRALARAFYKKLSGETVLPESLRV